jgi:hypothetical protein
VKKLGPRLRHLMRQRTAEIPELSERVGFRLVEERPSTVEVLVRCAGALTRCSVRHPDRSRPSAAEAPDATDCRSLRSRLPAR